MNNNTNDKNNKVNENIIYDPTEVDVDIIQSIQNFKDQINFTPCNSAIIVHERVNDVLRAYKMLKHITKGKNINISLSLNQPLKGCGSVSVVGRNLCFEDSCGFLSAIKLANNVDVFSRTDGVVQVDLGFYGLVKRM